MKELLGLVDVHARRNRHELLRHQRADRLVEVLLEADVARREDADGLLALDDRHAADVVLAHHLERRRAATATAATVTGPRIIPLSARFTRSTSRACSSIDRFLWMMPIPPSRAIVMAVRLSVTESIAAAEERDVQVEAAAEARLHVDVLGQYLAVRGDEQDVVERQALAERVVEHATV